MTSAPSSNSAAPDDRALLDRVRKLFDKANATSNVHEADAFSRKAAELVARHRIDPSRLAAADSGDRVVLEEMALGRGAYVRARLALLTTIGDHHDVRVVFRTTPAGMIAYLAGYASDVEIVELLYHSLHQQAASQMAGISRGTGAATQRFRRSFLMGFANRIGALLDSTEQEAGRGRAAAAVESTSVALRARSEQVDAFVRTEFGRVRAAAAATPAQATGWHAGAAAAERADVGRTRITDRRAIGR
jgi:hypothetical protein